MDEAQTSVTVLDDDWSEAVDESDVSYAPIEIESDTVVEEPVSLNDRILNRLIDWRWRALEMDRGNPYLWYGTALILILAGLLRFACLGRPATLVFDETYYVKDGWTLWNLGYEAVWPEDPNPAFEAGDVYSFTDEASYIVHPAVGKWMIALGMWLGGGPTNPAAWRLGNALVGMLAVFLMIRIARRLFHSDWIGLLAGLLMAVDGTAIVHSRTAILDQFVMIWALIAFWALLRDREYARRKLAAGYVRLGPRPWRWVAGIALGLCTGVKWSGIFFMAAFGILTVIWDLTARYQVAKTVSEAGLDHEYIDAPELEGEGLDLPEGEQSPESVIEPVEITQQSTSATPDTPERRIKLPKYISGAWSWYPRAFWLDAIPAFLSIVGVGIATYVASWWSWFASPGAFMRQWAVDSRAAGVENPGISWLPDALNSLIEYHRMQFTFHVGLDSPHPYMATPDGWIVQWRPTAFYWDRGEDVVGGCGNIQDCVAAIVGIGNPLLWWLGAFAIVLTIGLGIMYRDWRALAVLSGLVGGWLPWFLYWHRTIFTFYTIAFTPWVILTLCYPAAVMLERTVDRPRHRRIAVRVIWVLLGLILLVSAAFYPIWTAYRVPFSWWDFLMWLPSWV